MSWSQKNEFWICSGERTVMITKFAIVGIENMYTIGRRKNELSTWIAISSLDWSYWSLMKYWPGEPTQTTNLQNVLISSKTHRIHATECPMTHDYSNVNWKLQKFFSYNCQFSNSFNILLARTKCVRLNYAQRQVTFLNFSF